MPKISWMIKDIYGHQTDKWTPPSNLELRDELMAEILAREATNAPTYTNQNLYEWASLAETKLAHEECVGPLLVTYFWHQANLLAAEVFLG